MAIHIALKSIPEAIEILALHEHKPVVDLLVMLRLSTNHKNNYSLILAPTDSSGRSSISKEDLINDAIKTADLALMDYVPLEESYTGEIQAKVMTKTDVEHAIKAYEIYGADHYPNDYINILNRMLLSTIDIKDVELLVTQRLSKHD